MCSSDLRVLEQLRCEAYPPVVDGDAEFTEPELVELGHYIGFMSGGQRWLLTLHTQHGELAAEMAERAKQEQRRELAPAGK